LKWVDFESTRDLVIGLLPKLTDWPGNGSGIPREDKGADGSTDAEDQGDVGENEETLEREPRWLLRKVGRCFEEDQ